MPPAGNAANCFACFTGRTAPQSESACGLFPVFLHALFGCAGRAEVKQSIGRPQ